MRRRRDKKRIPLELKTAVQSCAIVPRSLKWIIERTTMFGIDAPIQERTTCGFDGTEITYYVAGRGPGLMIIAPGLGTPLLSWKYIIERFADIYTIVTWDIRGTYRSEAPEDPDALTVEDHTRDLVSIVREEGYDSFVLGGWSLGIQISLEYCNQFPEKVKGLVLINGAYEHVLSTVFQIPGANGLFTSVLKAGQTVSPVFNALVSYLLNMDSAVDIIGRAGLVTANYEHVGRLVRQFKDLDWNLYFRMMLAINEHSAAPYLEKIMAPTLIFAGTKDSMTPVKTSETMHSLIKGSQLFMVPNGTHYTVAEYPEIVNLRLERFLRDLDPSLFSDGA
jgi:pimeloyl-ACP methyl ester carboxylesterase